MHSATFDGGQLVRDDNMDDAAEVVGTYDGAPGTYRCNGDRRLHGNAHARRHGEGHHRGERRDGSSPRTTGAKVYVVDTEYASYGVWLQADHGRGRRADLRHG